MKNGTEQKILIGVSQRGLLFLGLFHLPKQREMGSVFA